VAKDNSFSYDGSTYTTNHKYNMVVFIADLHIHPMRKIIIFNDGKFIQEFKYKRKPNSKKGTFYLHNYTQDFYYLVKELFQ